jgi:hypothetical protein
MLNRSIKNEAIMDFGGIIITILLAIAGILIFLAALLAIFGPIIFLFKILGSLGTKPNAATSPRTYTPSSDDTHDEGDDRRYL